MKRMFILFFTILFLCLYGSQHALSQGNLVDPFDGSVSYSVPLLQGVTLGYSSSQVPTLMTSENRDMQASWVGAGWSFGMPAIEADLKGTASTDDDDWFYVDPNGGRAKIVKDNSSILRLENNPYWKVELTKVSGTNADSYVTGITVTRDDGSKLMFGDFADGSKKANRYVIRYAGHVTDLLTNRYTAGTICYRWDVSQSLDPYGVILLDYYYEQEQEAVNMEGIFLNYTRASYIDYILNRRTGQKIDFVLGDRNAAEYQDVETSQYRIKSYEKKYLDWIKLYPSQSATSPIQSWDFSYQIVGTGTKTKRLLQSITQYGSSNIRSLPSYGFSYDAANSYILNSVQNPAGGTTQVTSQPSVYTYLNQSTDGAATCITAGTLHDDGYQVGSSGNTVANYDKIGNVLRIRKWIGQWKVQPDIPLTFPTGATFQTMKVTDDHIFVASSKNIFVYDWRDDTQDWYLGLCESAGEFVAAGGPMFANMSATGSHVVMIGAEAGPNPTYTGVVWERSDLTRSWSYYQTTTISSFPSTMLEVSDDMAFYDGATASYLLQWKKKDGSYYWYGPTQVNTTSNPTNEQYSFQSEYIGRWDKTNGNLYAYSFRYNNGTGFQDVITQTLGTSFNITTGSNNAPKTFPVFTDERILLCEYSSATQANIRTWKRDGATSTSTFVALPAIQLSAEWSNSWAMKGQINNDWLFLINHRHGPGEDAILYDGRMWGYKWNQGSGVYEAQGTYDYAYTTSNIKAIDSADVSLTDDFVTVEGMAETVNGGTTYENFTDVFKLDRTSPLSWSSNKSRIFSVSESAIRKRITISGTQMVGSQSRDYAQAKVKFFHGTDKNWTNDISVYKVTQVVANDGMGNNVTENYTYDASPTFDDPLISPGYSSATKSIALGGTPPSQTGPTKIFFNNILSDPRRRGVITAVESYKQDGTTLVNRQAPDWSVIQDPVGQNTYTWYLFQLRKASETKMVDGISTSTTYEYNNSNGRVSKVTEDVDATSDIGDLRDRVTEFKYAFEQPQYPNMQTANMLSQIYQTTQTAVRPLSLLSSVHCEAPPEAWSGGTYEDTKQFTASFSQTVTYTVSNVWGCGSVRMGTTPGGSEIPILSSNGSASVTVPQGVIYVTARFAPYGQTTTGGAAINVNYDPGAPLTILLSDQQTEYDATMKYPTRTLVWNGTTWDATTTVVSRDIVGNVKESENINGVRSTTKWGWNSTLPVAQIQNARDAETSIVDFEDGTSGDWTNVGGSSISTAHTGTKGWSFTGTSQFISKTFPVSALPNTKYKFSGWLKTASTLPNLYWDILYNNGTTHAYIQSTAPQATNKWEYLETTADLSSYTNIVQVTLWSDPIKPDRQLGCSV